MGAPETRRAWLRGQCGWLLLVVLAAGCVFDLDRVWPERGVRPGDLDRRGEARPAGEGPGEGPGRLDGKPDLGICGDGKVTSGEECELLVPITRTCQDLGYTGGKPACNACKLEGCYRLLDPGGKAVFSIPNDQVAAAAASDGADFLIAWEHDSTPSSPGDIYGARIPGPGAWSPVPFEISKNAAWQAHPSVAFGGGNYLVAWAEPQGLPYAGGDTFGMLIPPIAPPGWAGTSKLLNLCGAACDLPRLAWNGTSFLLVFVDNESSSVRGQLLDAGGAQQKSPLDAAGFASGTSLSQPAEVASDGSSWLVVWDGWCQSTTTGSDICADRISSTGTLLTAKPIEVHSGPGHQTGPAVAFDGAGYLVVWGEAPPATPRSVFARRLDKAGQPLGNAFPIRVATADQHPSVAAIPGKGFLVVWQVASAAPTRQFVAARVSSQGAVLDTTPIPLSADQATIPEGRAAVAGAGSILLAVWQQATDIWGARVQVH